jgi:hypothetical protein
MGETAVTMSSGLAGYSMTRLALAQRNRMVVVVVSTAVARQSVRWHRMHSD